MKIKKEALETWKEIKESCPSTIQEFYGDQTKTWNETYKHITKLENIEDQISLAIHAKDNSAIFTLQEEIIINSPNILNDYQKNKLLELRQRNRNLLYTLNPFILQEKYSFLDQFIDEICLDIDIQDKILSLNNYELQMLKRIIKRIQELEIYPNNILKKVITNIGFSISTKDLNKLETTNNLLNSIEQYEQKSGNIDNETLDTLIYILSSGLIYNTNDVDELKNYKNFSRKYILNQLSKITDANTLKNSIFVYLFGLNRYDVFEILKRYHLSPCPTNIQNDDVIDEYNCLKIIYEEENLEVLKYITKSILEDEKFQLNPFRGQIIKDNILALFSKELNKCHPNFNEENFVEEKDGIKFYNSSNNFYAIIKVIGAFYKDDKNKNPYEEWNNDRYATHVNSVSLIRNDNLAIADFVSKNSNIILGFNNFDNRMFLGGGTFDINSTPQNTNSFGAFVYNNLYFPSELINKTRLGHNELVYERKDLSKFPKNFKKNPDFLVLVQEYEDITLRSKEEQDNYQKHYDLTINAAKDFGNLPILMVNRETIAKNELNEIKKLIENYYQTENFNYLKKAIIRFNNNRNGARGKKHEYIRNKYFSNQIFDDLFENIFSFIDSSQITDLIELLSSEKKSIEALIYDDSFDIPLGKYIDNLKNKLIK